MATGVDLNGIKESIQNILQNANTTTATPIYLSSGLANSAKVQNVLKVNPEMINPQASMFPLVTCYVTGKEISRMDIASSQLNAKRIGVVKVNVVGSLWNSNFSVIDEDPADEDINHLMENIELILRSDFNLTNKVQWQVAKEVQYYTSVLDEQTHLRSGILNLECKVFY